MAYGGAGGQEVFSVILLAGDRASDSLAQMAPCNRKALLSINGQPMILHVLNTLISTQSVGSIAVVVNRVREISEHSSIRDWVSECDPSGRVCFLEGAGSPASSVVAALESLSPEGSVLVTTADSPLLTPSTLEKFCRASLALTDADVAVGLATEQDIRKAFPDARRTFIQLKGGGYSGCNLFALMSGRASRAAEIWQDVEGRRKRPWQLISYFGYTTLFKALLGRLDLQAAFKAVSRSMSLNVNAVVLDDPLAAMDVDRPEHILIADAVLSQGSGATALIGP
tara:strand:+ start:2882 stop:3730 length:849 start_codon:yes stop_codon:yes gene_type:complete